MSLANAVLKAGATGLTTVGGADVTFGPDGQAVANGLHIAVAADTDFRVRRNMTIKNKVPALMADGSYTKSKKSVTFVQPKILANGQTVFNLVRVEIECHPESTASENTELSFIGGQILGDSDFTAFWDSGSLA